MSNEIRLTDTLSQILTLQKSANEFLDGAKLETSLVEMEMRQLTEQAINDPKNAGRGVGDLREEARGKATAAYFRRRQEQATALQETQRQIEANIAAAEARLQDITIPTPEDFERSPSVQALFASDRVMVAETHRTRHAVDALRVVMEFHGLGDVGELLAELEDREREGDRVAAKYLDTKITRTLGRQRRAAEQELGRVAPELSADQRRERITTDPRFRALVEQEQRFAAHRAARATPEATEHIRTLRADLARATTEALGLAAQEAWKGGNHSDAAINAMFEASRAKRLAKQSA